MNVRDEFQRYWVRPGIILVGIIVFDQITKALVWRELGPTPGTSVPILGDWLRLTLIFNTGVAFGMFQGFPQLFTLTSILISLGAIFFYRFQLPENVPWVQASVGLIVGGAIGNIIDRIRQSYVLDFVHVTWFPGIFNVADAAITIGVAMLAGYLLLLGDTERRTPLRPAKDDALLSDLLGQHTRRR
jgi:signal peptidase II